MTGRERRDETKEKAVLLHDSGPHVFSCDTSGDDGTGWRRLRDLVHSGRFPQCVAIAVPEEKHGATASAVASMLLCREGRGGDSCPSCAGWTEGGHPDLMQGGTVGTPPTIDACREIIRWAAYRPVLATRRVAVFFAADKMALPAANSILKMAEEPQEYAYSIFLLSNPDLLLPTIRSRAWTISLQPAEKTSAFPPPSTAEEWIHWMEKNVDTDVDGLVAQLSPWIRHEVEKGRPEVAARLDRLRMLLKTGRLSQTMSFDLIVWALKEGMAFEHVFDDIW